jgi:lipid-A-disaccharide synthase
LKYYIIAGEASGDLHGSNLLKEIRKKDPSAVFRAWGGDMMQKQGAEIVKHYRELAFMGFAEVIANLRTIMRNMKFCVQDILEWKPDVVIMIDYPGFNLRVAEKIKPHGVKVFYYISPQVWAWKQSRVHKIKKVVDEMFVILPFEKDFYQKFDYKVHYVGHPLLDAIKELPPPDDFEIRKQSGAGNKPIVALLPGSRKQEIKKMLPYMIAMEKSFPEYHFIIAGAPSIEPAFYKQVLAGSGIGVVSGKTYDLIRIAKAALVTSGTATLETALLNTPEVVCYKGSPISYMIAKRVIKVKYISLVNLIMDKLVVKELIQYDLNNESLQKELNLLLHDEVYRKRMLAEYEALRTLLGAEGASEKTASLMLKTLGMSL